MDYRKTLLDRAIEIAVDEHAGETEKTGSPYILHSLRSMLRCDAADTDAQIVAVLHDTILDIPMRAEMQRGGIFPDRIVEAFECLKCIYKEPYEKYIERVSKNPIARRAKIAKLTEVIESSRVDTLRPPKIERLKEYAKALRYLVDNP